MKLPPVRRLFAAALCLLACTLAAAAPPSSSAPKALLAQVQRLAELLRDSQAVYYPGATLLQRVRLPDGEALVLAVFTVEGFGGGNGHTQYLAAFTPDRDGQGPEHFMLIDVMPIGGKGWRGVSKLDARVSRLPEGGETRISFDALEVADGDAPNFPTHKATVQIVLKAGRLAERARR
jgi:hypothetical protein